MDDDADREAEEAVDLPHPFGVAFGEVIVDRDDVHALALERIEIDGQGGDQRLAFAGLHLGDLAFVQHHAADQLDVEMPLAKRALGGLAHCRECLGQKILQGLAVAPPLLERGRHREKFIVRFCFELGFQRIDLRDKRLLGLDLAVVHRAEKAG